MNLIEVLKTNYSDKYDITFNAYGNLIQIMCRDSKLNNTIVSICNNTVEFSTGEFITVKKHYDDECMLIKNISSFLQMVEGVFYLEKNGVKSLLVNNIEW